MSQQQETKGLEGEVSPRQSLGLAPSRRGWVRGGDLCVRVCLCVCVCVCVCWGRGLQEAKKLEDIKFQSVKKLYESKADACVLRWAGRLWLAARSRAASRCLRGGGARGGGVARVYWVLCSSGKFADVLKKAASYEQKSKKESDWVRSGTNAPV